MDLNDQREYETAFELIRYKGTVTKLLQHNLLYAYRRAYSVYCGVSQGKVFPQSAAVGEICAILDIAETLNVQIIKPPPEKAYEGTGLLVAQETVNLVERQVEAYRGRHRRPLQPADVGIVPRDGTKLSESVPDVSDM